MKPAHLLLSATALIALLAACSTPPAPPQEAAAAPAPPAPPMPGSDRDAHGCIGSAGYAWCGASGQCERPWELAKAKGFENTPAAFAAYCGNPPGA